MLERLAKMYHRVLQALFSDRTQEGTVVLDDLDGPSIRFNVQSGVERYRTAQLGGEREALEVFLDVLEPGDAVYDVGANIGLYTVAAAVQVTEGTVVAFEPEPEINNRLRANIDLNRLSNVRVVDWAASDEEGSVDLHSDGVDGYSPTMREQTREGAPTGTVEIETRAIDSALARDELPRPDVLKIDIEGAEALCLSGCETLLKGKYGPKPRIIFIEVHPQFLPDYGSTAEEVNKKIQEAGYEVEWSRKREEQEHLLYVRR